MEKAPASPSRSPTLPQVGAHHSHLLGRLRPSGVLHLPLQVSPGRRSLARAGTVDVGVDAGRRVRGRPLGRCHTLDPAEGPAGSTGGTGAPLPAPEATPPLPRQTPVHAAPVSADESHEPSEQCPRPQGPLLELNGEPEPRPPAAPTDGRCS